jgi:hypothetical protein
MALEAAVRATTAAVDDDDCDTAAPDAKKQRGA